MMHLENPKFNSLTDMMSYIRGLTLADKRKILRGYGYDVDSIDSTRKQELLADYIVQGLHRGITGKKLVGYANNMSSGVISMMPYFGKPDGAPKVVNTAPVSVAKPTKMAETVVSRAVETARTKKAKSLPVAKKTKSDKVKYADGTVFFRTDRQKWVVVIDNKQPAARPTKDGVIKWLAKKYPEIVPVVI